jgi:hypothetical protein
MSLLQGTVALHVPESHLTPEPLHVPPAQQASPTRPHDRQVLPAQTLLPLQPDGQQGCPVPPHVTQRELALQVRFIDGWHAPPWQQGWFGPPQATHVMEGSQMAPAAQVVGSQQASPIAPHWESETVKTCWSVSPTGL